MKILKIILLCMSLPVIASNTHDYFSSSEIQRKYQLNSIDQLPLKIRIYQESIKFLTKNRNSNKYWEQEDKQVVDMIEQTKCDIEKMKQYWRTYCKR